ncbi:MAG: sugar transferase [Oligoflexia bacterium]|nr:sugar transferase [Oligoflexia bacterium]
MRIFGIPVNLRQLYYLLGDLVVLVLAIVLAYELRLGSNVDISDLYLMPQSVGSYVLVTLLMLYLFGAYDPNVDFRRPTQLLRLWTAILLSLSVQILLHFLLDERLWGRGIVGLTTLSTAVLLSIWRPLACWLNPASVFRRRVLILGEGEASQLIIDAINSNLEIRQRYDVVGLIEHAPYGYRRVGDQTPTDAAHAVPDGLPVLGRTADLKAQVLAHRVDLVIVAIRGSMGGELARLLLECKTMGVQIEDMATLYKVITGKVPILNLSDSWFIFGPVFAGSSRFSAAGQRLTDIVLSLFGLVLSAPIIALAAVAVVLQSKGSPFYLQERVGRDEVTFKIIKLRTMRSDAEALTGAVWSAGANDPRVTWVGRWLRRTRVDELPQFWNVLRGEMSLVGPRPERQHFVCQLKKRIPFYGLRFSVKPGVTGWAQVNFRYGATEADAAEKLSYEVFAIQELNPLLYLLIMLKTVQTVLLRPGS